MVNGAPANILDFGAVGDGVTDDTAAIQAALDSSASEIIVPTGVYLISATIAVPYGKKLTMLSGNGPSGSPFLPQSRFVKASTFSGTAITLSYGSILSGGGLECLAGNGGDGVAIISGRATIENFSVSGAGNDGIRVGKDAGGNCNTFSLARVTVRNSGRYGIYIHDGTAGDPDVNAGSVYDVFCYANGSDGIRIGKAFWNSLTNVLTEVNGGYGVYLSNTLYSGTPECRYTTILGGDYNESNTSGSMYFGGYDNTLYLPNTTQAISDVGTRNAIFGGGLGTSVYRITTNQIQFPATQVPSGNPNMLDDYEEGSFTPTIFGTSTAGVGTYVTQEGKYTKIGQVVYFEVDLEWSAHTGTGGLRMSLDTLPVAGNAGVFKTPCAISASDLTFTGQIVAYVVRSTNLVYLRQFASGSAESDISMDTSASIRVAGFYFV